MVEPCTPLCPYFSTTWPRNLPKASCRIAYELTKEHNPVTICSLKWILANRTEDNTHTTCNQQVNRTVDKRSE